MLVRFPELDLEFLCPKSPEGSDDASKESKGLQHKEVNSKCGGDQDHTTGLNENTEKTPPNQDPPNPSSCT